MLFADIDGASVWLVGRSTVGTDVAEPIGQEIEQRPQFRQNVLRAGVDGPNGRVACNLLILQHPHEPASGQILPDKKLGRLK